MEVPMREWIAEIAGLVAVVVCVAVWPLLFSMMFSGGL
jgi:hypothetical protein